MIHLKTREKQEANSRSGKEMARDTTEWERKEQHTESKC